MSIDDEFSSDRTYFGLYSYRVSSRTYSSL